MISAVCKHLFQRVERRPLLAQKAQRCGDVLRALTVAERPRNRAFHLPLQRYFLREDIRAPRQPVGVISRPPARRFPRITLCGSASAG